MLGRAGMRASGDPNLDEDNFASLCTAWSAHVSSQDLGKTDKLSLM